MAIDTATKSLQAISITQRKNKTGELLEKKSSHENVFERRISHHRKHIIKYPEGKRFSFRSSELLAHCISANIKMSSGIARTFN